jgi:transposase
MSEMNQEKPKAYSAEFRESSMKLTIGSDQPIAQTARDLGINANTLPTWITKYSRPKEQDIHTFFLFSRLLKIQYNRSICSDHSVILI